MREKGQFVHASNVLDINSSSMKRVLTGVSPARPSDTTHHPSVWSPEKQVWSSLPFPWCFPELQSCWQPQPLCGQEAEYLHGWVLDIETSG